MTNQARILMTFPWRQDCSSSILCEALIDREWADRITWITPKTELARSLGPADRVPPTERRAVDFRFDVVRSPRLVNSLLFRLGLYQSAQGLTISRRIDECVSQLEQMVAEVKPSALWMLGDQYLVPIMDRLLDRVALPSHLTVHDLPEAKLWHHSRWPHLQARLVEASWRRLLERVNSIDVVSQGMADYIKRLSERTSLVIPPVPRVPLANLPPRPRSRSLRVGMSGCWFGMDDAICSFKAGLEQAVQQGMFDRVEWLWLDGVNARRNPRLKPLFDSPSTVVISAKPRLSQEEAVAALAECDILYLPYWNENKLLDTTSNPSKLSIYLPAVRPIIVHGATDSVPVQFANRHHLGVPWTNREPGDLKAVLKTCLEQLDNWGALRAQYQRVIDEHLSNDKNRENFWRMMRATIRGERTE